jgi:Flp pilus assembly CpaE family ATPase
VIAAELRPGQGTWAVELGQNHKDGLTTLLRKPVSEITATAVENELVRMPYGVRLLMASPRAKDAELMCACEPLDTLLAHVTTLAPVVLLDVGTSYHPSLEAVLHHCNEVMVVTEPFPSCVQRTRALVEDLNGMGFGKAKLLSVISTNRVRADMQLSMIQIQESLGMPVAHVFPPAPEVAYQAASRALPIMQVQVGGTLSQQYLSLAEKLEQRIPK